MLDKFKFWKKDDDALDLDLGTSADQNNGLDQHQWTDTNQFTDPFSQNTPPAQGWTDMNQQTNSPTGMPSYPQQPFQQSPPLEHSQQPFQQAFQQPASEQWRQQPQSEQSNTVHSRDIELVLSRLETLKASVDHLSTRIEQLERTDNRSRW